MYLKMLREIEIVQSDVSSSAVDEARYHAPVTSLTMLTLTVGWQPKGYVLQKSPYSLPLVETQA